MLMIELIPGKRTTECEEVYILEGKMVEENQWLERIGSNGGGARLPQTELESNRFAPALTILTC